MAMGNLIQNLVIIVEDLNQIVFQIMEFYKHKMVISTLVNLKIKLIMDMVSFLVRNYCEDTLELFFKVNVQD